MAAHPVYHAILVVDVEDSSGRTDAEKPLMRKALYEALIVAFARAGLSWDACRTEDRGDGVYVLIPPTVPKLLLAGLLVESIDRVLMEYRPDRTTWPRLRLSLHAGEVAFDADGSSGRDVDLAFALSDADQVREVLRANPAARCVLVVSEPFHAALAQGDAGWSDGFRPVSVRTKSGPRSGWISLPGRPGARQEPPGDTTTARAVGGGTVPWRVQVGIPGGPDCGLGLLLPRGFVLTCAHLVPGGRMVPRGVAVAFGTGASRVTRRAGVIEWIDLAAPAGESHGSPVGAGVGEQPGAGVDVVVLQVPPDLPSAAAPAPLGRLGRAAPGRRLAVPGPTPGTVEITGCADPTGELVRVTHLDACASFGVAGRWCSCCPPGAPVVDRAAGVVVGMLVANAGRSTPGEAVMISIEAVAGRWSPLARMLDARRGDQTADDGVDGAPVVSPIEFALALAELGALATVADRDQVVEMLGQLHPDISGTVRRHADRRFDVASLVRTCRQYPDGLDDLIAILWRIEGDSIPMRNAMNLRSRLAQ